MIGRHTFSAFVCIIFQCVALVGFFNNDITRNIMGGAFATAYLVLMYMGAWRMGERDTRSYTPLNRECRWSFLWAAILVSINLILCGVYKYMWTNVITAEGIPPVGSIILNLIFYFWNAPYIAFIKTGGEIAWYVLAMMVALPTIGCIFGYFMGSKKLAIMDKVEGFKFEKAENEE